MKCTNIHGDMYMYLFKNHVLVKNQKLGSLVNYLLLKLNNFQCFSM